MEFHEAANIFPLMADEKLEELASDIQANGLAVPIEVCNKKIIDGRNRYLACLRSGVTPKFKDVCPVDPIVYVVSLNKHRRHLTTAQESMVGAKARDYYDKQAKERLKLNNETKEKLPYSEKGQSRDLAGKAVGVSGKSIDHATKVLRHGSQELIEACETGSVAISAAAKLAELPKEKQSAIISSATELKRPIKKVVAKAAKHVVRAVDSDWEQSEIDRREQVKKGMTVLANKRADQRLLRWASEEGLLVPIDRGTCWGNPFVMGEDGDRDQVCDNYEWYLDKKPSLQSKIDTLKGKVLACWCYPARCHGDCLCKECNSDS